MRSIKNGAESSQIDLLIKYSIHVKSFIYLISDFSVNTKTQLLGILKFFEYHFFRLSCKYKIYYPKISESVIVLKYIF